MTKFLQTILNVREPIFSAGMTQLEKATGNSGVDVRLIADIIEKSHAVMRQLSLDPRDTTGKELYFALNSAVKHGISESLLSDTDYVLLVMEGTTISFNMIDVIENSHHNMPYTRQIISHGQRSLRGELVGRYIDHARTDEVTVREMADHIGLLPEMDTWYTEVKNKRKRAEKHQKEPSK